MLNNTQTVAAKAMAEIVMIATRMELELDLEVEGLTKAQFFVLSSILLQIGFPAQPRAGHTMN